jgi:DUF2934 family protein
MSVTTTTRRRWTDAAIETELRAVSADLGHFPTRPELVSRGMRGLWDAMRSSEGVDAWRERLEAGQSAPDEEIAYTNGGQSAPQDEMAHSNGAHPAPHAETAHTNGVGPATHEEIAARAYELYEGGNPGGSVDHWLAAERELRATAR